jgi:hypothetical protein
LGVRDDDSKATADTENTMHLLSNPLSVRKGEVLHHMFAEDTIERLIWERERSAEVNQIVHVLITKSIDIHPVSTVNASRAGTEVQE